jgi:hypothetical protein
MIALRELSNKPWASRPPLRLPMRDLFLWLRQPIVWILTRSPRIYRAIVSDEAESSSEVGFRIRRKLKAAVAKTNKHPFVGSGMAVSTSEALTKVVPPAKLT